MIEIEVIQKYKEFFNKIFKVRCPNCGGVAVVTGTEEEEFNRGYRYARFCSSCGFRRLILYTELLEASKEFGLEDFIETIFGEFK